MENQLSELTMKRCLSQINNGPGYIIGKLDDQELKNLQDLARQQFLQVIKDVASEYYEQYATAGMEDYHVIYRPEHFDHAQVWGKHNRIYPANFAEQALALPGLSSLLGQFASVEISDEENLGRANLYWRLVRPGNCDIGPVHADKWFWDLGHGEMPAGHFRLKIWIALYAVAGQSGLRVVPGSQLKDDWKYHGEQRGSMVKPVLDELESDLELYNLPLDAGQFVLFHDALLHGGMPNQSNKSRVSLEFTLIVKES